MKGKGNSGGGGSPSWGGIAGSAINKVLGLMGYGGYMPKSTVPGAWLAMGEPSGNAQQFGVMWAGAGNYNFTLGATTVLHGIMIESPRVALAVNSPPGIERFNVSMIDGQLDIGIITPGASTSFGIGVGSVQISVGMYKAQVLAGTGTTLYQTQDPSVASDISRGDWFYLESRNLLFQAPTGTTSAPGANAPLVPVNAPLTPKLFDFCNPNFGCSLSPGEALMLSVAVTTQFGNSASEATIDLCPAIRGFVSRVA